MFCDKTMVRGVMAVGISSILVLVASSAVDGAVVLTYTTPGEYSVTLPACAADIQCWGAGGNGSTGFYMMDKNGGGGGGYSESYLTLAAGTYCFQVGQGGGGQGSSSSIGSADTVWSYTTTMSPHATGGSDADGAAGTFGAGGAGFGGNVWNNTGGNGAFGTVEPGPSSAGGGGGSAGPHQNGSNGSSDGGSGQGYAAGGTGGIYLRPSQDGTNGSFPGGGGGGYFTFVTHGANGELIITYFAPATIALTNAINTTIITGGTGTLGTTVTNSVSSGDNNLNYTLDAAVQNGSATLGSPTHASGTLAPGSSQSCTIPATSTNLGINTIAFTASDPNSSNLSQTTTATLTVLDHSNVSLSASATQTNQTINFGNVLRGATIPGQNFTIYNRAANTSAAYTANLQLTGFSTSGNTAFQTNLVNFNGLTAVSGSNGNTFMASLNTGSYMTGSGTISMSASQLVDDSSLPGAGSNNNGAITVTLQGNVGNATADKSNPQITFGIPLTAPVANNASYVNLESKATATTGSGGQSMVGSTATILAGTNSSSSAQTVSMAWRTQTLAERTSPELISDIVDLSGMALSGSSGQTAPFVLQMNYSPALLPGGAGNEALWASNEWLYLGRLNPLDDEWENAIDGNVGSNSDHFYLGAWPTGDMTLGDWGVNTANHTVWAVVNYNGDFAVVPEPSSIALLAAGAIGLIGYKWRRRQKMTGKLRRRTHYYSAGFLFVVAFLSFGSLGRAELINNLDGTITEVNNDGSRLLWMQDARYAETSGISADGTMTHDTAMSWASTLSFAGYTNWRLPVTSNNTAGSGGYNQNSEMGNLYYNELGNTPGSFTNAGPFSNIMDYWYWTSTDFVDPTFAMVFSFRDIPSSPQDEAGWEDAGWKPGPAYVWLVHDLPAVPEPSTLALLGAGAIGLIGYRWRRKQKLAGESHDQDETEGPAILSFPNQSTESKRRAA